MEIESPGLNTPSHYTVEEVFTESIRLVRGFTQKNYKIGMHSQGFYEINIVLRGEAVHFIGKRHLQVSAGDTFIIPPNVMHGYLGGAGFDVYHILISPKYLEKNGAELQLLPAFSSLFRLDPLMRENTSSSLYFRLEASEISELLPRLEELSVRSRAPGTANAIITNSDVLSVIVWLCDLYEKRGIATSSVKSDDKDFLASIAYIYEHYGEKLPLDRLASIARMSRTAYINKFKQMIGSPPARFIRLYRLEMAKQMLIGTSMTESQIATAVGFTDTSHLIKIFLSELGISPLAYRQSARSS